MKTSAICAPGNRQWPPTISCHSAFNRLARAMQSRQHFFPRQRLDIVAVTHADVETVHRLSCSGTNRHRNRAQSQLQLLRHERVALTAHLEDLGLKRSCLV